MFLKNEPEDGHCSGEKLTVKNDRSTPFLSLVIPFYNESRCIDGVCSELHRVLSENSDTIPTWECILVDDGSQDLTGQMMRVLPQWSLAPVVDALVALRGIDKLAAMMVLAELGDISRFDSPRQLMAFLGLVPSEHSTDSRRRQGSITRKGDGGNNN